MKTEPKNNQVRTRKDYKQAFASMWQQETPEDFFTALFVMMTTPTQSVYKKAHKKWKIQKDSISAKFMFDTDGVTSLPAVQKYVEDHVPEKGCHIVGFDDSAIVLYYELVTNGRETTGPNPGYAKHLVAMLSSYNSF